jgi:hypothetical protein
VTSSLAGSQISRYLMLQVVSGKFL